MVILECDKIRGCLQNERDGLIQIKSYFSSISQYGSKVLSSWKVDDEKSDCCEWEGIECKASSGHITHLFFNSTIWPNEEWVVNMTMFNPFQELTVLDLSNNKIQNLVQSEGFGMLKSLQELDLSYFNNFVSLPELLWNLSSLRVLDLSGNYLAGALDGRVCKLRNLRELYLPSNRLNGSLPDCLWNLTSLQVLDLLGNSFSENLPSSINLPSLEWLSIKDNSFHGKFSLSSLTNHSNLKVLMLSNNALQVEIGDSSLALSRMQLQVLGLANCSLNIHTNTLNNVLFFQSNLQYLDLSNNSLVGSFPTWLLQNNSDLRLLYLQKNSFTGTLQLPLQRNLSLVLLDISSNEFVGAIPGHIGITLSALKMLAMSDNSLQGQIPYSLGNMTQLEILDLTNNNFSGKVPEKLYSDCTRLGFLALSNNSLDGEIIPSNMNLPSLYVLRLDGNHFVGTIKESLKISTRLGLLDISDNKATGELPTWIESLSVLGVISLARNHFHGSIPSQICKLPQLDHLDLSENWLTGEMPSCGCPSQLSELLLHGNNLTGPIPKGLQRCSHLLRVLDLTSNRLSGGIPRWINMLPKLEIVLLKDNQLQGELPIQLCQLQQLNIFDVSNNNISGVIPSCLHNLSFGAIQADYSLSAGGGVDVLYSFELFKLRNHYILQDDVGKENDIYEEVSFIVKSRYATYKGTRVSIMSVLDLSCNQFYGYIPPELGDLTILNTLNLSHNHLSGGIPESFSKLKSIESVDLSWNKLSGAIPYQLVELNFLEVFNVSYNNLSGKVPEMGQFGSFDENNYRGNALLCGSQLLNNCIVKEPPSNPPLQPEDEGDTAFDLEVFFWSFGASFIIVLLTFFSVLYIDSHWRRACFTFLDYHLLWWL